MKTKVAFLFISFCFAFHAYTQNKPAEEIKAVGKIELDSLYNDGLILELFGKPQDIKSYELEDIGVCTSYTYPKFFMEFNEGGLIGMNIETPEIKINGKLGVGDSIEGLKVFDCLEIQKIKTNKKGYINYIVYFGMEEWFVFHTKDGIIESFTYSILLV